MTDTPTIKLAAAITMHDDHVLVVRRSMQEGFLPGVWGVPCGKVDQGETPKDAVLRELQEETGLQGEVVDFVGTTFFTSQWHGRNVRNEQSNFLVRVSNQPMNSAEAAFPRVTLPYPDQRYEWVPAEKIEYIGLDEHNLTTIHQGLRKHFPFHLVRAKSSSSRRRL